ncbi:MAG: indolepyruvate oxidoreductase subunit beta family protein [Zoogloeaceae bacterium]|jgi:indolepyruvate ferredoxin oxidoreductase beta subunit|nr:indolepyruvate oxidoreductase subunit beta family protein [Zoogloeaceae bacterium]
MGSKEIIMSEKAICIAILAMGGEGGGVLADWIVDLAEQAGFHAQTTSVPGVAQRTGATIYYVEIYPGANSAPNDDCQPVLSLMPVPGHVDIVIASELMEAGRAIQRGLVTRNKTTLIASTHRVYSMTEKMAMGDSRVDSKKLISAAASAAQRFIHADFASLAQKSESVISAALFGALAGARLLPFSRDDFEAAIRRGGVGIKSSLAAFAAGFDSIQTSDATVTAASPAKPMPGPALARLVQRIDLKFPIESHAVLHAGIIRLADYQDVAYAGEFLDYLEPILLQDSPHGDARYGLLHEAARHLALWMSYNDAIRVADLKIRRKRFERVENEVEYREDQLLEIDDFFHPRIEEIADIMPAGFGRWLLKSKLLQRFKMGGRVIKTTSVRGYMQLYVVSSLRRWRRSSLRFQLERQRILAWLDLIRSTASINYELAVAIAKAQKLIKGYGDTHHRGNSNFDAVLNALTRIQAQNNPAATMEQLIHAALADENGLALKKALDALAP